MTADQIVAWRRRERLNNITPEQCRGARAMLGWTKGQLVRAAGVTDLVVTMFEIGKRVPEPRLLSRIQSELEDAGILFLAAENSEGPGLRLREQDSKLPHLEPTGLLRKL